MKRYAFNQWRRVLWTVLLLATFSACASKTPEEKLALAKKYLQQRAIFDCLSVCEDIIQSASPNDPILKEARFLAAQCYLQTNQLDRARTYWADIVADYGIEDERGFGAFHNLIMAYIVDPEVSKDKKKQQQEGDRALKEIGEKRKTLKPQSPFYFRVRFLEADVLNALERTTDTLNVYTEMIEDKATTTVAKFQVAQRASMFMGSQRLIAKAIAWNEEQIKHFKDTDYETETHLILSQLCQENGDEEKAEKYLKLTFDALDEQIAEAPGADHKIAIMGRKAQALKTLDRFDAAADVFRQAAAKFPKSKSAPQLLGLVATTYAEKGHFHRKKRDKKTADAAFDQALVELKKMSEQYADDPRIRDGVYRAILETQEWKQRPLPPAPIDRETLTSGTLNAGATSGTLDANTSATLDANTTPTTPVNVK